MPTIFGMKTKLVSTSLMVQLKSEDWQPLGTGCNYQTEQCDIHSKKLQKLMLENDLKISSDEESEQVSQKSLLTAISESSPMQQIQGTASVHYNDEPSSSSESESSSESDSEVEIYSNDANNSKPSHIPTPEPEQTSTSKWQLDKWLNKVNSQNNNTATVSTNCNYGLGNDQFHSLPQKKNPERAKTLLLSQADFKDRENQTPIGEKRLTAAHKTKRCKQKLPTHDESASSGRSMGKEQSRRTAEMSVEGDVSLLDTENHSIICKGRGSQNSSTSEQHKTKPNDNKIGPKRELQMSTLCEKRKYSATGENVPKSSDFFGTECLSSSSSSGPRLDSDNEEFLPAKFPPTSASPDSHKLNDCSDSLSSIRSCSAVTSVNKTINESTNDSEAQLFALVPFGRNELLSPLKDNEEFQSLWVKIDLTLLSRIPGQSSKESLTQKNVVEGICNSNVSKGCSPSREKPSTKSIRKRKCENIDAYNKNKKNHLDEEPLIAVLPSNDSSSLPCQQALSIDELSKQTNESEKILQRSFSSLPSISNQKHPNENNTTAGGNNDTVLPSSSSSTFSSLKHWKSESPCHTKDTSKGLHVNSESNLSNRPPQASSWLSASKGQKDVWRPRLVFDEKQHNADYYLQEAKRKKHKADALMEKFEKAVNYIDAALSFIECGNAMEHGPLEAKSPYMMYSETVELIRYAMRLKTHSGATATQADKQLAALCYRCLALLYWRMFRLKRDNAVKYSKALINYFKCNRKKVLNSSIAHAAVHQKDLCQYCGQSLQFKHTNHCCNFQQKKDSGEIAKTSNLWDASGKCIRTSSSMLPTPSLVSSAGSHESSSSNIRSSPSSTINIPQRIHQLAANHVYITNSILYSYDYWEIADKLTKENKEFFHDLDAQMEPITLHSSMTHLVQYTQQGLHWIQISNHML
ncbi:AF4/FMR2 family member 3 isoform X2 [Scyliorhinus canicula]|uniref:AF4/FMR2 family member 3 isoform X2 n=2 Tax=Scyliorhinus canicula TaxID=7830 RepID=UPI0018F5C9E7|nr:AF4/FMR2 family member 3 isoform X2 [Scyliorhinus canicula]